MMPNYSYSYIITRLHTLHGDEFDTRMKQYIFIMTMTTLILQFKVFISLLDNLKPLVYMYLVTFLQVWLNCIVKQDTFHHDLIPQNLYLTLSCNTCVLWYGRFLSLYSVQVHTTFSFIYEKPWHRRNISMFLHDAPYI